MNGILGHDFALLRLYWGRATWANEMNFVMNHAPGAGSIVRPVDQQSSVLPLYHGCPYKHRVQIQPTYAEIVGV